MLAALIAALIVSGSPDALPAQTLAPLQQQSLPPGEAPTDLEDIVVEGRSLDSQVGSFVREVGQPADGRGLARWRTGVCASVINLQNDVAHYLVDRVSDVARDVGLSAGAPGCTPNILIIATADAQTFTPQFVASRPRLFRVGGSGMDIGDSGLRTFESSDAAVRWWHVSVPVDETGHIAIRLPGYCENSCQDTLDMAPKIKTMASHLQSSTEDDIRRVFIILDVNKTSRVELAQLGDYVAMVALAQINPEADTSGYATVLNLFDDPARTPGLTNWDRTYLEGLYRAARTQQNRNGARTEIASSIVRAHHRLAAREDERP